MTILLLAGCQTVKYETLETFGVEKRDILADDVEEARDAQGEAREQFSSALEQFRATIDVEGGELEETYDRLDREYQRSKKRASAVSERIDEVEQVGDDLFDEWEDELEEYSDANLRRRSASILDDTRGRYDRMLTAMRRAEQTMKPVLDLFHDQVLFLKHNLNSMAISSLREELSRIELETEALIRAMNASIAEADAFIESLD